MTIVRSLWQRIHSIKPRQLAFLAIGLGVLLIMFIGVAYVWDYTNSPTFCGTTCHTMPPEYAAWQRSPHARVSCVECHIGRDFITTSFTRKAGDLRHVILYSSGRFEFPLYAKTMLPAREACEKCHWPQKFSNDRSVAVNHFDTNEKNSLITTYLLVKTGGGLQREGHGLGIHWHIENQVDFIALDDLKQQIPWVQVTDASGKVTTYIDTENPLTQEEINKATKYRMDCIDCHNRISHTFRNPEQAVDEALTLQRLDPQMPYIKSKALDLLNGLYKDFDEADRAIDRLGTFYTQSYPDYAKNNAAKIKQATDYLKTLYRELVFPTQDLSWTTHPDNLGHRDWPGCFRCHDGKHLTTDTKQAIRLECNVCHTLPEVGTPGGAAPVIQLTTTDEPDSHKTTTWLYEHRSVFNTSCQACHDTNNAGGKDNTSFCSNSACHGQNWKYVGLDAPSLTKIFPAPASPKSAPGAAPAQVPHPIGGNPDCLICHGQNSKVRPFPADHIGRAKDVCLACHKPTVPPSTPSISNTAAGVPPSIPHDTAGRTQCLGCHGNGAQGVPQIPQFHKDYGFTNNNCLTCHKAGQASTTAKPTVAPTVAPTVVPTVNPTSAPSGSASSSSSTSSAVSSSSSATSSTASSSGVAKPLRPDHAGRTTCLVCHGNNLGPKPPADHAGRTDTMCLLCHK